MPSDQQQCRRRRERKFRLSCHRALQLHVSLSLSNNGSVPTSSVRRFSPFWPGFCDSTTLFAFLHCHAFGIAVSGDHLARELHTKGHEMPWRLHHERAVRPCFLRLGAAACHKHARPVGHSTDAINRACILRMTFPSVPLHSHFLPGHPLTDSQCCVRRFGAAWKQWLGPRR